MDIAVTKAVNMCNNPVAVAAAKTGVFGEHMVIEQVNSGPFTAFFEK